ncbi:MAG TPA: hypothetical protein VGG45_00380 [Terracidiphilus sp.]|jgi:hypothetical protein
MHDRHGIYLDMVVSIDLFFFNQPLHMRSNGLWNSTYTYLPPGATAHKQDRVAAENAVGHPKEYADSLWNSGR